MLLPTRGPAPDAPAPTLLAGPRPGRAAEDGRVAPQCAPSTAATVSEAMPNARPGHRDTSADYPKDPRQKSIAGYGSQPYAFDMAAQAGSARTQGDPTGSVDTADHTPSSFEYRSRLKVFGLPLVHVVRGIDPSSGRRPTAVGIIAVGQVAVGLVAVGQVAVGAISLGQASIGLGWGIGQLAFGMIAVGQVAAGLLGAAGQLAVAPHALGMVTDTGMFVATGWLIAGLLLAFAARRRQRRLGALLATPAPTGIASVRDGCAHVAAEVISADQLRAPLSSRPCVFWHTVRVGPAMREHERSGGNVAIGDATGQASIDFDSEVIFIRSDNYREIAGPDWALHIETSLARGETLHVAGPVTMASDASAGAPYRGGVAPVFAGQRGSPLIVTTRNPFALRTELRFAAAFAWTLVASGALAALSWALLL
jgi:hypothetical protein